MDENIDELINEYNMLLYKRSKLLLEEMEKENEEFFARHK